MQDKKFLFTRSYNYQALEGRRRNYFFELKDRTLDTVSFRLRDKGNFKIIEAPLQDEEGVECCTFDLNGVTIDLYSDCYIPKGYSDMQQREDDRLKDAAIFNHNHREALADADQCGCYSCLRVFNPTEIESWTDNGTTAICPYCDVDAIIPDPAPSILKKLHKKYF